MRWELFGARRACVYVRLSSLTVQFFLTAVRLESLTYLVAVSREGSLDLLGHRGSEHVGTAEFADPLLIFARGQMARAGGPVLDLSVRREPKPLLRAFVCLLLGHGRVSKPSRSWRLGGIHQCSNLAAE